MNRKIEEEKFVCMFERKNQNLEPIDFVVTASPATKRMNLW